MHDPVPALRGPAGLIVASPAARVGKTTVTLGLLAALRGRGVAVGATKAGPDLADPAWLAAAAGRPCHNLDPWAMDRALLDHVVGRAGGTAELLLCDGQMGLFDDLAAAAPAADGNGDGATAALARHGGWPVVLVIDGRGVAQSAAALVSGFAGGGVGHGAGVRVAGVVLNRVVDARHQRLATDAIAALGIPVLGALPDDPDSALPGRASGAVPDATTAEAGRRLDALGRLLAANVDIDRLRGVAAPWSPAGGAAPRLVPPPGQRIAVAHDAAFGQLYPHVLDGWQAAGAELMIFSPLADEAPPPYADAVYLPGGAPHRHAPALAAARRFHDGLRAQAARGPVYGEGGGYAVLGEVLHTAAGGFPMAGLLGLQTAVPADRQSGGGAVPSPGHRRVRLLADHALGRAATAFLAHEDRPLVVTDPGLDDPLFAAGPADRPTVGSRRGAVSGSFLHLLAPAAPC